MGNTQAVRYYGGAMKSITLLNLQPKARTYRGNRYQPTETNEFHAEIVTGKSVRIFGVNRNHIKGPQKFDLTFALWDEAIYDSFNLIYIGKISAIGAKSVTISDGRDHRLSVHEFCRRNCNFDAARVARHNAEELQCL